MATHGIDSKTEPRVLAAYSIGVNGTDERGETVPDLGNGPRPP